MASASIPDRCYSSTQKIYPDYTTTPSPSWLHKEPQSSSSVPQDIISPQLPPKQATTASYTNSPWHPSQSHAQGPLNFQNQQQQYQQINLLEDFPLYPPLPQRSWNAGPPPATQNMDFLSSFPGDAALFNEGGSTHYATDGVFLSPSPESALVTSFDQDSVTPDMIHYSSSNPPSGAFSDQFFSPEAAGLSYDFGALNGLPLFDQPAAVSPAVLSATHGSSDSLASAQSPAASKAKGHVRKTSIQKVPTFKKARKGKNKDLSFDPNDESSVKRFNNSMAARQSRARREHRMKQLTATVETMREKLRAFGYDGPLLDGLVDVEGGDQDDDGDE